MTTDVRRHDHDHRGSTERRRARRLRGDARRDQRAPDDLPADRTERWQGSHTPRLDVRPRRRGGHGERAEVQDVRMDHRAPRPRPRDREDLPPVPARRPGSARDDHRRRGRLGAHREPVRPAEGAGREARARGARPSGAGRAAGGRGDRRRRAGLAPMTDALTDSYSHYQSTGMWKTEAESASAFDERVRGTGMFRIYSERQGILLQPQVTQKDKTVRIDRILVPTRELLDLGWQLKTIGVEIKRSGKELREVLSQAVDYTRSVFDLDGLAWVMPSNVYIWPMEKQGGPLASLMVHLRVGTASCGGSDRIKFSLGEEVHFSDDTHHGIRVRDAAKVPRSGRRVGSR